MQEEARVPRENHDATRIAGIVSSRDLFVAGVIFTVAAMFGMSYVSVWGDYARFEQQQYGPAVMVALGRGYQNPARGAFPGLDEFLARDTEQLAIHPEQLPAVISTKPLTQLQVRWLYAITTVGYLWRLFGTISWEALLPLYGFLYGATAAALYAIFRLGMNRGVSCLGAAILILSPGNLFFLPHLRDYSKAPTILFCIFVLGYLIKKPLKTVPLLLISTLLGAVIGLSMGFRKDVIICIPAAVVVLAVFIEGKPWERWRAKAAAIALLLISFIGCGWPIIMGMEREGNNNFHVIIYGLMAPFDEFMGISDAPYTLGYRSNDSSTYYAVKSHAVRMGYAPDPDAAIVYGSLDYDAACFHYWRDVVKVFPADILLKPYAAILSILDYGPFVSSEESRYGARRVSLIEDMFNERWRLFHWMGGLGKYLALAALLLFSAFNLRYGLGATFLLAYFLGYTCLQFDLRHHFHLEFVTWWFLLFVVCQVIRTAIWLSRRDNRESLGAVVSWPRPWRAPWARRMAVTVLVLVLGFSVPVFAARAYQSYSAGQFYHLCATAELEPVEVQAVQDKASTMFQPKTPPTPVDTRPGNPWTVYTDYLVAEFKGEKDTACWATPNPFAQFVVPASTGDGGAAGIRCFLPIYECQSANPWGRREFSGVGMWTSQVDQFKGLYRVKDPRLFPLLLDVNVPGDGQTLPRYRTFDPDAVPLYFRGLRAARGNVLPNGGFEEWQDAPDGFEIPRGHSTIAKETARVAEASNAVCQTWTDSDGNTSLFDKFRIEIGGLKPSTTYELFVKACNYGNSPALFSAWELAQAPGEPQPIATRLEYALINAKPCPTFTEYSGCFTTGPDADATVILCTSYSGPGFPATVLWDDVRLFRRAPPAKFIRIN